MHSRTHVHTYTCILQDEHTGALVVSGMVEQRQPPATHGSALHCILAIHLFLTPESVHDCPAINPLCVQPQKMLLKAAFYLPVKLDANRSRAVRAFESAFLDEAHGWSAGFVRDGAEDGVVSS